MEEYYRRRAQEYEEIYFRDDPTRQKELQEITAKLKELFACHRVVDVACGTGFWTEVLSEAAARVTAIDITDEMLEIAESKHYQSPLDFCRCEALCLPFVQGAFDGGLASFWISHVPKARLQDFLAEFHRVLKNGARVFMADNVYVRGVGGELLTRKGDEDTYKARKLKDGSEHLILKNYFSAEELIKLFGDYASKLGREDMHFGKCYWYVTYKSR